MDTHYKIKTEQHPVEPAVTLLLNGKFSEDALPDLDQSVSAAKGSHKRVYIDLSEVTLVDRKTIQYFSEQAGQNVKIVNCPIYLRGWIAQAEN
jgi:ABC-type transporter Mla MlaB component